MEPWQKVWRDGFAPVLSVAALRALARGLTEFSERIVQGRTTVPALKGDGPEACEGADPIGYAVWFGDHDGNATVGQVDEWFSRACFEADRRLGEPAACRFFLNWWDDTLAATAVPALLAEVRGALAEREQRASLAAV